MKIKALRISSAFLVLAIYLVLILSALYYFEPGLFLKILTAKRTLFAINISLVSATVASFLAIAIAIPAAYALSRYQFPGRKIIDLILELPLIISPAALGALILIFFSNPLGEWVQEHSIRVIYSFWGIVAAQFVTTLGIATRFVKSAIDELPRRYEQVSRTLGATAVKAFRTVTLPLSRQGIIAAFFLTWAKAFGEFGATVTVAGTMAMKTETVPVSIFMQMSNANMDAGIVLIFILVLAGLSVLFLTRLITKKSPYA